MDTVKHSNAKTTIGCFFSILLNFRWLSKLIFPKIDF